MSEIFDFFNHYLYNHEHKHVSICLFLLGTFFISRVFNKDDARLTTLLRRLRGGGTICVCNTYVVAVNIVPVLVRIFCCSAIEFVIPERIKGD